MLTFCAWEMLVYRKRFAGADGRRVRDRPPTRYSDSTKCDLNERGNDWNTEAQNVALDRINFRRVARSS